MTKRQNDKPPLPAEPAYENAHLVAQDLVDRIREPQLMGRSSLSGAGRSNSWKATNANP